MTTKTFIVTVSNPGSGNRYYIDGVLQATVNLAQEGTYRFDQSDSSNATHPLRLSETSDGTHGGGSEYTTGVTTSGTPGSPGAYTEIVVARGAPNPLYYYCTNHSGMGGQANVTSNSWGALEWGEGNWAGQGDNTVQVTGQELEITNVSGNGITFTAQADAQISTDENKFGGSSLKLDGSGDRIQSTDITLGTDSYTWETFAYFNSFASTQCIWDAGENVGASQNPVVYITSTNLQLSYAGGTYINAAHGMSADTWHHIAITRNGNTLTAYIDGTSIGTGSYALGSGATNHVLGGNFAGTFTMNGYLDESRLTRKVVYTGNFTPPSSALSQDPVNDIWLLHYDGANGSTDIVNSVSFNYTDQTADIDVTGIQLTATNAGATGGTSVDLTASGIQSTFSVGQVVTGFGVNITGNSLSTSIGAVTINEDLLTGEGWGRDTWGSLAWGVNYSVQVSGQELTITGGEEDAGTDFVAEVTGQELTSTFGTFSIISDVGVTVFASEDQIDASVGSSSITGDANVTVTSAGELSSSIGVVVPEPKIPVDVTGISLTMTLGTFTLVQGTTESVTGQELTGSVGQVDAVSVAEVCGIELTGSVGSVTVIGGAGIDVSGISATISVGSVNITSWNEIDTGVSNTWSDVDLAA